MNLVERAIIYSQSCHERTNHLYDGHPYTIHLIEVVAWAEKFIHWVPQNMYDHIIAACWCHDIIEDCRETYNDVLRATSPDVAELVYALTNEKGKSRAERANEKYYDGLLKAHGGVFVKLCDRLANAQYSRDTNSQKLKTYQQEQEYFFERLKMPLGYSVPGGRDLAYWDMWDKLNQLLNI